MPRISTRTLSDGIGSLAQAIAGGQGTFDQAAEQGAIGQSKIAQAIAAIRASDATARLHGVQADDVQAGLDAQKPEAIRRNAMTGFGIPLDEESNVESYLKTGQLGGKYQPLPSDQSGPVSASPDWARNLSPMARQIMSVQNGLTLGDKNTLNVAKAAGEVENQGRVRDVIDGRLPASTFGQAIAASEGKPIVSGHEFGVVNNFTGAVDDKNPVAVRFGAYRDSETTKNKEQAGAAKASAAHSYAGADKLRQDKELGAKGVLQQTDQGLVLVDPRTATARPVNGLDGKPLQGKTGNLTEGERKAATLLTRLRGSQDQLLDAIGESPKAVKPSTAAEFVRSIPWFGGNTPANLITPEARQRVEAAQLDMLDAALTLGTGAAYTREQLVGYSKSYFPQIGDDPKTVADKKVRLTNVIRAAEIAAGKAVELAPKSKVRPEGGWGDGKTQDGATVSNW